MTWNYRLCRRVFAPPHPTYDDYETRFAIHEVYYDEDGQISGYTEQPVSFGGDSAGDVVISLQRAIINASTKSVVDLDELDKKFAKARKKDEKKQAALSKTKKSASRKKTKKGA